MTQCWVGFKPITFPTKSGCLNQKICHVPVPVKSSHPCYVMYNIIQNLVREKTRNPGKKKIWCKSRPPILITKLPLLEMRIIVGKVESDSDKQILFENFPSSPFPYFPFPTHFPSATLKNKFYANSTPTNCLTFGNFKWN